jgi:hypothetical protein
VETGSLSHIQLGRDLISYRTARIVGDTRFASLAVHALMERITLRHLPAGTKCYYVASAWEQSFTGLQQNPIIARKLLKIFAARAFPFEAVLSMLQLFR